MLLQRIRGDNLAKNIFGTLGGAYVPPEYNTDEDDMSDGMLVVLNAFRDMIDERIESRIKDGQDIAKVYDAEIIESEKVINPDNIVSSITVGDKDYDIKIPVVTSIKVRYNEDDYVDISNGTVKVLDVNDKWCKICTYDGVQFYVLHRL